MSTVSLLTQTCCCRHMQALQRELSGMRTVSPRAASNEGGLSPRATSTAGVSSPSPRVTAVSASAVATAEAAAGNGGSEAGTKGGSGHSTSSSREGSRCGIIQSNAGRGEALSRGVSKVSPQTTGLTLLHVRKAGRSVVNGLYEQHVHGAADGVAKWVHKRAPCVLLRYAMADGTFPSSSCTPNDAS